MKSNADVGAALFTARGTMGLSQQELASSMPSRFDFKQQTIDKIEKGKRKLSYLEARALVELIPFGAVDVHGGAHYRKVALEQVRLMIDKELSL